jgi:hypothetical protein
MVSWNSPTGDYGTLHALALIHGKDLFPNPSCKIELCGICDHSEGEEIMFAIGNFIHMS